MLKQKANWNIIHIARMHPTTAIHLLCAGAQSTVFAFSLVLRMDLVSKKKKKTRNEKTLYEEYKTMVINELKSTST